MIWSTKHNHSSFLPHVPQLDSKFYRSHICISCWSNDTPSSPHGRLQPLWKGRSPQVHRSWSSLSSLQVETSIISSETSWSEGGGEMLWARTMMWKHLATRWDSDKLLPSSPVLHRATHLMTIMMLMMVIMLQNSNFISASSLNAWVQKNVGRHLWCCCSFSFKFYLSCVSFKLWVFGPYFKCQNYLFDRASKVFIWKDIGWGMRTGGGWWLAGAAGLLSDFAWLWSAPLLLQTVHHWTLAHTSE